MDPLKDSKVPPESICPRLDPFFVNEVVCVVCFSFRPDLIDFDKLKKSNAHYNLQNAFNLAEQHLGLTKLLDPEGEKQNRSNTASDI